jgi:hypothetical protein
VPKKLKGCRRDIFDHMKPTQIFLLVIAVVVLGVVASRFIPERMANQNEIAPAETAKPINPDLPPQAGAILQIREGSATLIRRDERFSAHDGLDFKPGDQLEVGEESDVTIIWPHYGRTVLAAGSVVRFQKVFESTNRERFEGKISLERGRMWTKFYDTLFQGQTFQIRIGSVLLDASGGSFGVTRGEGGDVTIDVRDQAVRALTVIDEVPTGEMRKAGFDEMFAETAQSEITEIGGRAVQMSQDGSMNDVSASADAFAESGDAPISRDALDVQPSSATLLPESSL